MITQRVVFEAPILSRTSSLASRRNLPRVQKDSDCDRYVPAMDQIIHHKRDTKLALLVHISSAVIEDHQVGIRSPIVLLRHVDPVFAFGTRINVFTRPGPVNNGALRNALLAHGVLPQFVIVGRIAVRAGEQSDQSNAGQLDRTDQCVIQGGSHWQYHPAEE